MQVKVENTRICKNESAIAIRRSTLRIFNKLIFVSKRRVLIKLLQMYRAKVGVLLLSMKTMMKKLQRLAIWLVELIMKVNNFFF